MQSIGWYWNRLNRMSPAEMAYRVRKATVNRAQRFGLLTVGQVPAPNLRKPEDAWLANTSGVDPELYTQAAERVVGGHIRVFALQDAQLGAVPRWNRDPRTGIEAPLLFGKGIDYRDERLVGDIKYLWEPNRHLQLVTLAQAYHLTGAQQYLTALETQLSSWFEQCPYLKGPNWTSSLELAIRLINWSIVWRLIGGKESPLFDGERGAAFRSRWLRSAYQHIHFIGNHLSRFSSANNHLIGEAAGIFSAACAWPLWRTVHKWRDAAQRILIEECQAQTHNDGVNKEQAVSYQQFVLDFLLLCAFAGREREIEFPPSYWHRIEAMLEYLASIMDSAGNVPMIGDADDGYAVRLSQEHDFCPYRSLLATGAIVFGRADFKRKAGRLDDKTRWLTGSQAQEKFDDLGESSAVNLPVRTAFPDGGYYILGCDFETSQEIRLTADTGPLGYLSIAAHGHADALAVTLSAGGREFLIDPGTYAYHTGKAWRDYFRGTAAHNTVLVDGLDQSEIGGNFMWTHHAAARCLRWQSNADEDVFSGVHDGYQRLADPVSHQRDIRLVKRRKQIVISDRLDCEGTHTVTRCWHFAENCRIVTDGPTINSENDGVCVRITAGEADVEAIVLAGSIDPPGGWVSRSFDSKTPTTSIFWRQQQTGPVELQTTIDCFVAS